MRRAVIIPNIYSVLTIYYASAVTQIIHLIPTSISKKYSYPHFTDERA